MFMLPECPFEWRTRKQGHQFPQFFEQVGNFYYHPEVMINRDFPDKSKFHNRLISISESEQVHLEALEKSVEKEPKLKKELEKHKAQLKKDATTKAENWLRLTNPFYFPNLKHKIAKEKELLGEEADGKEVKKIVEKYDKLHEEKVKEIKSRVFLETNNMFNLFSVGSQTFFNHLVGQHFKVIKESYKRDKYVHPALCVVQQCFTLDVLRKQLKDHYEQLNKSLEINTKTKGVMTNEGQQAIAVLEQQKQQLLAIHPWLAS